MTAEALEFISEVLNNAGIDYEFGTWSSHPIPTTYFVGEYTDIESVNEDGMQQTTFLLTGTSKKSAWLELIGIKEKIEELFPSIGGKVAQIDNGSTVAIFFDTSFVIPTDTMNMKRIQINLTIKEWKVR